MLAGHEAEGWSLKDKCSTDGTEGQTDSAYSTGGSERWAMCNRVARVNWLNQLADSPHFTLAEVWRLKPACGGSLKGLRLHSKPLVTLLVHARFSAPRSSMMAGGRIHFVSLEWKITQAGAETTCWVALLYYCYPARLDWGRDMQSKRK